MDAGALGLAFDRDPGSVALPVAGAISWTPLGVQAALITLVAQAGM